LTSDGLVVAPSWVYRHPLERFTVHSHHPGRSS
jgi:hypothetical protein